MKMPEVSGIPRRLTRSIHVPFWLPASAGKVSPMNPGKHVTVLLGIAGLALVTTIVVAAQTASAKSQAPGPRPAAKASSGPVRVPVSVPPLPNVGFAPVRPMDVVRATYDFAAN